MAAPSGTSWGSIYGSYYRLGIYTSLSSTNTQTTVSIQVWLWSKWNLSDSYNSYYFNNNATSATTLRASNIDLSHSVSTGAGWSTSNQTKLGSYSYTYNRGTSAQTIYCAAKLKSLGSNDVTPVHSKSYTIPALTSYTVSYNANGGSGAPSSQTKYYGKTLTLTSTKPTRTGYTFLGWNTSSTATSASYASGASYTGNAALTLYAVWKANTYTISYNANGGSGAPSSQTKTYGVTLTLSSTKPTRANYDFLGWGVSASSTSAAYASGANYTANASVTLYAVWKLAHTPPTITKPTVDRCLSDGTLDEDGTYIKVAFSWTTLAAPTIKIEWKVSTATSWSSSSSTLTGTSGSFSKVVGGNSISTDLIYNVRITVNDGTVSTVVNLTLSARAYPIDVLPGGVGISFGGPAATSNLLDCHFNAKFRGSSTFNGAVTGTSGKFTSLYDKNDRLIRNGLVAYESAGIDPDTTLEHEILTSMNTPNGGFMYIITYFYLSKSTSSNRMQIAFPYNRKEGPYYRYYMDGSWSDWLRIGGHFYSSSQATDVWTGDMWMGQYPVYRRWVRSTISTTGSNITINTISEFGELINMQGNFRKDSSGSSTPLNHWYSSSNYTAAWVDDAGGIVVRSTNTGIATVIVDYVKSS